MQDKKTLLDRARIDLVNVTMNLENTSDELFLDDISQALKIVDDSPSHCPKKLLDS